MQKKQFSLATLRRVLRLVLLHASLLFAPLFSNGCGDFGGLMAKSAQLGSSSSTIAASAPNQLNGVRLYEAKCSMCHQTLAQSTRLGATVDQIRSALVTVPDMGILKGLITSDEMAAISWVLNGGQPVPLSQQQKFACAPTRPTGHSELRRLTRYELTNTLQDLLGPQVMANVAASLLAIPADSADFGFDDINHGASGTHIDAYAALGSDVGNYIVGDFPTLTALAGNCATVGSVTDVCVTNFISTFGRKAFRRPLSGSEVTDLLALFRSAAADIGDPLEGYRNLFSYFVQSPYFLYKVEQGDTLMATPDGKTYALNAYELATRLSYLIWGTLPDATLSSHADDGSLLNDTTYRQELDRLMADNRAKVHYRHFYQQWLATKRQPLMYSMNFLNGINPANLGTDMATELQDFMDYTVWEQKGNFNNLMTSEYVFPRSNELATIYGVTPWTDGQAPPRAPAGVRAGLVTRAQFLAQGLDGGHPIIRGVFIRRKFLCGILPPPTPAAFPPDALVPPTADGTHSTRQLFEAKTASPMCMRCHSLINPVGFALLNFDSLGRVQTQERLFDLSGTLLGIQPVDASASISLSPPEVVSLNGGASLGNAIAQSDSGAACFATQWYQYAMGRVEDDNDGCSLNQVLTGVTADSTGSVINMIKQTALAPAFRVHKSDD